MDKCQIHCTDDSTPLVSPKGFDSWKNLLLAALIRKNEAILNIAETLSPNTIPHIKYHRRCRQIFIMKDSLQAMLSANHQVDELGSAGTSGIRTSQRGKTATSTGSHVLPKVCIFCMKCSKYVKKSREKLVESSELRADATVRKAAQKRCDERMLTITSHELHASEACYHASCYKCYTCSLYKHESNPGENTSCESKSLNRIKIFVKEQVENNKFGEYKTLLDLLEKEMRLENIDEIQMKTTKHNLRRTLERSIHELRFASDDKGKLLVYSENVNVAALVCGNHAL